MSETRDLLIEIGSEELPPKALRRLRDAFRQGIETGLEKAELAFTSTRAYAAPRRLAVLVQGLQTGQADREQLKRGPAVTAAFDDEGCPTRAAEGFARSCGVTVDALETLETDKGAWLAYKQFEPGRPAAELIPDIVTQALNQLPIPKRMRWGDRDDEFVRPVHWVVLLFGDAVIDATILGTPTGRETRGHRFHHPDLLYLAEPAAYVPLLETEGHVLADMDARREAIRGQVIEAARRLGGEALIDDDLLDEVTALVEWPVAISGGFDPPFLEVPAEALVSSMQDHQKYFPVVDGNGTLLPHFITIANLESRDPDQVRAGNERVIRPRLTDAAFFWEQDRRQPLETRQKRLASMVFQKKLGTLLDKSQRVARLASTVAGAIEADPDQAERAALLSKCDLLTQMVFEFPELQGVMGRYYALHDGEPEAVARALDEQYMPRFAGDRLPATATGQVLAIADRLDTLVGIFAIGQAPTGDKDPFALRRAALGIVRILIECELDLDLQLLLDEAAAGFTPDIKAGKVTGEVFDFMLDRLRAYYSETGLDIHIFEAVRAQTPTRPLDFHRRIEAVREFGRLAEAESLAAANKRIGNILRKAESAVPDQVNTDLLTEPAEQALHTAIEQLRPKVEPLFERGQYTEALCMLAALREPVDSFFDQVMVMAEDTALRDNRLALLQGLQALFLRTADLSLLQ
ncbi:glycine--tRNA ligase subunit beta [Thiohalobacter thiocyanaticus]|uniref:Glycine--tRNA ligase beta subunit n=1 Tax=Thiohalobacter thiocyanaticus TaxID=585455 RepID=A0A426QJU9_9GAMM|nr:glycine--tRNA ligase subunit beta [Thiohalobacter thiocyanaticus]RRQ21986.1 glycine--tRNA ligase subunit beta [Thiohalobacter thiocyanaticus]